MTLTRATIHGVTTNRDLLVNILTHPSFLAGDTDTAFFDRHGLPELSTLLATDDTVKLATVAAALASAARNRTDARVLGRLPSGWRNIAAVPQVKKFRTGDTEHEVRYRFTRDGLVVEGLPDARLIDTTPTEVVLETGGLVRTFEVDSRGQDWFVDSPSGAVTLTELPRFADPATQLAAGSLLAPMPGTVVRIAVARGERVTEGQPLLWLEAMKMQHQINAPTDGVVTELGVGPGDQVEVGRVLAVVSAEEES
jgi:propionyl-CoA carboxylase alpha chain